MVLPCGRWTSLVADCTWHTVEEWFILMVNLIIYFCLFKNKTIPVCLCAAGLWGKQVGAGAKELEHPAADCGGEVWRKEKGCKSQVADESHGGVGEVRSKVGHPGSDLKGQLLPPAQISLGETLDPYQSENAAVTSSLNWNTINYTLENEQPFSLEALWNLSP